MIIFIIFMCFLIFLIGSILMQPILDKIFDINSEPNYNNLNKMKNKNYIRKLKFEKIING